jgi:Nif-specific regulatory protein
VVPLFLPPLRERREDLPLLIEHFTERFNTANGRSVSFSGDAMRYMIGYHWPGNIRELENTIQRIVVLSEFDVVEGRDLPQHILMYDVEDAREQELTLEAEVEMLERSRIVAALRENGNVQARAASVLGITPRQLGYKIAKYDIQAR